ncbi:HU family DNA-binding protein [Candidatus Bipolaricaulota bacterium]|nr:HU family DNA-binding protein [Candidatus Bipolaricaulota bacterium]
MNKGEFVDELSEKTGFTKKDSKKALDSMLEIITGALEEGDYVMFTGFGKFEPRARKATTRLNPRTGDEIEVPAKVVPKFKAGKTLKETVQENLEAVETDDGLEIEKK